MPIVSALFATRILPRWTCNRALPSARHHVIRAERDFSSRRAVEEHAMARAKPAWRGQDLPRPEQRRPECLELKLANRHGLVTGATGTGKTVTLQVLAEGFSAAGVPVFAADIKGDLSGISAMGQGRTGSPSAPRRSASTTGPTPPSRPCSGTCSASRAIPSAPPCRIWGRCCCRGCWSSTRRRKACSTSCSAWPPTRRCRCSI